MAGCQLHKRPKSGSGKFYFASAVNVGFGSGRPVTETGHGNTASRWGMVCPCVLKNAEWRAVVEVLEYTRSLPENLL